MANNRKPAPEFIPSPLNSPPPMSFAQRYQQERQAAAVHAQGASAMDSNGTHYGGPTGPVGGYGSIPQVDEGEVSYDSNGNPYSNNTNEQNPEPAVQLFQQQQSYSLPPLPFQQQFQQQTASLEPQFHQRGPSPSKVLSPISEAGSTFSQHPQRYTSPPSLAYRAFSPPMDSSTPTLDATLASLGRGGPSPVYSTLSHVSHNSQHVQAISPPPQQPYGYPVAVLSPPPPFQVPSPFSPPQVHPNGGAYMPLNPPQTSPQQQYLPLPVQAHQGYQQPYGHGGSYDRSPSRSPTPPLVYDEGQDNESPDLNDYGEEERKFGFHQQQQQHIFSPYGTGTDDYDKSFDDKEHLAPGSPTDSLYASPLIPSETQHFGAPPTEPIRRRGQRKTRQVALQGAGQHYSEDFRAPAQLKEYGKMMYTYGVRPEEYETCKYTAITCDPDDVVSQQYSLRQNTLDGGRHTELFIVITMYNEDEILLLRTLWGVMSNIHHLCQRKNSSWTKNGWKKVVVCIVADGRDNVHPKVLDVLTYLGLYQAGRMKKNVGNDATQAHLFEYTTCFGVDETYESKFAGTSPVVPTQMMLCIKENNAKKINSHRWFFNAFAPLLDPRVCILLDVGTRPVQKSIYRLWKTFDNSSNVGGACGEIAVYKGKFGNKLLNPLVASQNFEYKMSNILDKPTESVFGYISVLPGAFSAYRYKALENDPKTGEGPLQKYFLGETMHGAGADVFTANMYLAEDRILCFELVARENKEWVLKYVKDAVGETDVPEQVAEFIAQRRRWLNGSLFAAFYAIWHTRRIWQSGHRLPRKIFMMIEVVYNAINLVFTWFSMANYFIFYVILTSSLESSSFSLNTSAIKAFNTVTQYVYLGTLASCFLFSMGNRPAGSKWKYAIAIIIFATLTVYMVICAGVCAYKAGQQVGQPIFLQMLVSLLATYGIYVISSILAFDPWHILSSFVQYILLSPTYVNVLSVYAMSNINDLSWGTKENGKKQTELTQTTLTGDGKIEVQDESLPSVDVIFREVQRSIIQMKNDKSRGKEPRRKRSVDVKQKDYYANFRTNVLLVWVITNALLAIVILAGSTSESFSQSGSKQAVYMACILSFVALTSAVRFIGSCFYLLVRLFTGH